MRFTKQLKCAVVLCIVSLVGGCDVPGFFDTGNVCKTYTSDDVKYLNDVDSALVSMGPTGCDKVNGQIIRKDDPRTLGEVIEERLRGGDGLRDIYGNPIIFVDSEESGGKTGGGTDDGETGGGTDDGSPPASGGTGDGKTDGDKGTEGIDKDAKDRVFVTDNYGNVTQLK